MIGRDYDSVGINGSVYRCFGDNRGSPYTGPGKVEFIDKNTIGVIDKESGLHIQSLGGGITAHIIPQKKKANTGECVSKQDALALTDVEPDSNSNFMEVSFGDFCNVPLTKNIAVADKLSNTIRIVNRELWSIERTFGQGDEKGGTEFGVIAGISCFQLGYKTYYCICESDTDRVALLSEGGHVLQVIGQSGILPGEFDKPVAIASCVLRHHARAFSSPSPVLPEWYIGSKPASSCETAARRHIHSPGTFFVCSRPKTEGLFDIAYVAPSGSIAKANIRARRDAETDELTMSIILSGGIKLKPWPSVAHAVRNFKEFRKMEDPRPYVMIAVAESGTRRVQVFKYFWTQSDLYAPEVQLAFELGGYRKSGGCEVRDPTSVAFTPTGELLICDSGLKHILFLSSGMHSVKTMRIPFVSGVPSDSIPSGYHKFPTAPPYGKPLVDPRTGEALPDTASTRDITPVSVSISPDGKIAVLYKRGGLLVFRPHKVYDVGSFEYMKTATFDHLLSYLEYADYESLRECCVRFHNHTSRLRRRWSLSPLGGEKRRAIAVCQFLKWATLSSSTYNTVSAKTASNCPGSPSKFQSPNLIKHITLLDDSTRECCYRKWIDMPNYTNMLEFGSRSVKTDGCGNIVCHLSHEVPVIEFYAIEKLGGQIDVRCALLACSKLFGDNFLWKKEPYVVHLFNALADLVEAERLRDPMTRANEVIREVVSDVDRRLGIKSFMELMTICEEDFAGAKPFRRQFLFHRLRLEKPIAAAITNDPLLSMLQFGNLAEVIRSDDDIPQLLHVNREKQYEHSINVPYRRRKDKRHKVVEGAEQEERGVDTRPNLVHNLAFIHKVDKVENMLDGLFS